MGKCWNIVQADLSQTTGFAVEEFIRLMKKMDPEATFTKNADAPALTIGISDALPCPQVANPKLDDAISIAVSEGSGYITGSNVRSVLMGVYRFFQEAGVSYLRPGRDGERVPKKDSMTLQVALTDTPVLRYRGICLEGSAGYEHIVDMIDFAPKIGLNIFFTQLWRPSFTLDRWYNHKQSPAFVPAPLSEEAQDSLVEEYDRQIQLRGIDHHRMGHGWMSLILGEKSGIWHGISKPGLLQEEHRPMLAYIGGKRDLYNGSAIDTNFCYSNPDTRRRIIEEVIAYAKANPQLDTLHVWLADKADNQCECDACTATMPADLYIQLLNDLDIELTKEGLDTRIVFLSYLELLWTAKEAKIKNPDRFILLFAPIRRPYWEPLSHQTKGEKLPFIRNAYKNPCDNFSGLHYFNDWKKEFPGECIVFDYPLMWDMYRDMTGESVATMAGLDAGDMRKLGFDGNISCQNLRLDMIGALAMRLMGLAFWKGQIDLEAETAKFYAEAYAEDGAAVRDVLAAARKALNPNLFRGVEKMPENQSQLIADAKKAIASLDATVAKYRRHEDFCLRVSYLYLESQLILLDKLLDFLLATFQKDEAQARILWDRCVTCAYEIEALYPRCLDAFEFSLVWHRDILPFLFPHWHIDPSGEITM